MSEDIKFCRYSGRTPASVLPNLSDQSQKEIYIKVWKHDEQINGNDHRAVESLCGEIIINALQLILLHGKEPGKHLLRPFFGYFSDACLESIKNMISGILSNLNVPGNQGVIQLHAATGQVVDWQAVAREAVTRRAAVLRATALQATALQAFAREAVARQAATLQAVNWLAVARRAADLQANDQLVATLRAVDRQATDQLDFTLQAADLQGWQSVALRITIALQAVNWQSVALRALDELATAFQTVIDLIGEMQQSSVDLELRL